VLSTPGLLNCIMISPDYFFRLFLDSDLITVQEPNRRHNCRIGLPNPENMIKIDHYRLRMVLRGSAPDKRWHL